MSRAEYVDLNQKGVERTISFSQADLDPVDLARKRALQALDEIAPGDPTSGLPRQLNIDLSEVASIASTGLNELIRIRTNARGRGVRLVLVGVQQQVRDVFALTRLERMFDFSETAH